MSLITNGTGSIDTTRPIDNGKPLIMSIFPFGIKHHRGSLGSIAIFMGISRNASHTLDREVERLQRKSCILHEANQKSSKTSINVDWNVVFESQFGDFFNVVNATVSELRSWSDQHAGAGTNRRTHFAEVDPLGHGVHWDVTNSNIQ